MSNPDQNFLHTDAIADLARENLPPHYRLIGVRFDDGGVMASLPASIEIRIEFFSMLDEELQGTSEDVAAFQAWANPLIEKIRREWPKEAIRISFAQRLPPDA